MAAHAGGFASCGSSPPGCTMGRRRICEAHGFLAEALPLAASTGKPVCGCYLRPDLHNLSDQAVASLALALLAGVHFNHELDLQLKQDCQRIFEQTHTI